MIDSLKIKLVNFSGDLKNCREVKPRVLFKDVEKKDYGYNNFRLYNRSNSEQHYLRISKNKKTGAVTITGSFRKWFYNRVTLLDISQKDFVKTLNKLADELFITFDELKQANFTQCEIGANVRTRIPAIDILPLIVDYAHYKRLDEYINQGTLYFEGNDRLLKLYVKDDEIAAHSFSEEKRNLKKRTFDRLKAKGIHYLRIELTMKNHRAFKNKGLNHIRTIGDLIDHYSDLYNLWTKEISRIIVFNELIYNESELKKREKDIILGLRASGFFKFVDNYSNNYVSRTKTKNSAKSAKSEAYGAILSVLNKYYDREEYNKFTLKADVAKYLIGKSKQFQLDLPLLIRNLWGISYNNK